MNIRTATTLDRDGIRRVHLNAFPEGEGEIISRLAVELLSENTTPETISLVADMDGDIVGHVAFSPVTIDRDDNFRGYILAPLAVAPDHQHHGIGSRLIEHGLQQLSATGTNVVFVYGDPDYYGRFGFTADAANHYNAPYKLEYPFGWQALVLNGQAITNPPVAIRCVASLSDPELW